MNCFVNHIQMLFEEFYLFSQVKPRMARRSQKQHLPNVLRHPHTHVRHHLSRLYPLSRNAGRPSPSPQATVTARHSCQLHSCLHLAHKLQVKLSSSALADLQTLPSRLPPPPQLVPLRASSFSPLHPNQVKAMPSSYPHLGETKIPMSPKKLFPLRPTSSKLLGNAVQVKTPSDLLLLLLWCAALCRTCLWTMRLCAGWPLRRPLLHLLSTKGPEAGLGQPACLLLPVSPSERKMRRRTMSRG